jgi:hypothetical protein
LRSSFERFRLFIYLFCWILWFVVVFERRRLKRNIKVRFWRKFERRIRVCRLSLCWIFCVERRSFRLWILWFDLDSFFVVCFWVFCVFEFFFDFKKSREWRLVVVYVVLFDEKKRVKSWKKNCLHFVFICLFFSCFVCRKLVRFCFFCFWISWMIVCCSEFEEKRDRSQKRDKVPWWKNCHKKRCFEFLWNEQFESFVIKQILRRNRRDWRKRKREKKTFLFQVLCY